MIGRIAALAACLALAALPRGAQSAGAPFEIPVFAALTGTFAFVGAEEAKSFSVLAGVVNRNGGIKGRPVKFVISDDQSNPQISAQLMSQAIAAGAPVVFGGGLASTCNAAAGLIHDSGPVLYCLSPGVHPPAGSYVYSAGLSSADQILVSVRYFRAMGWHNVALITTTDATGQDADQTIDGVFALPENRAEKVVAHEHFAIGDFTIGAQVARIRSAGADVALGWVSGTPLGTLLHGFRDAGLDVPIVATAGNASFPVMHAFASVLPAQMLFPGLFALSPESAPTPAIRAAIDKFDAALKAENIVPDGGYEIAWDPASIVVAALQKYGDTATAAQIRTYIDGVRGYNGIVGRFDYRAFPQRGLGPDQIPMLRWNAAKATFDPVSKGGGGLLCKSPPC